MITIIVGPEERSFKVHKEVICATSKFFKTACSEKILRQPDGTPEQYKTYVDWASTSELDIETEDPDLQLSGLIDLFILGDVLDDYQFRNATMEQLIATTLGSTHSFSFEQLDKVYAATVAGSPLRLFVVWWLLVNMNHRHFKSNVAQYPAELVQEVAVANLERHAQLTDKESVRLLRVLVKPEKDTA